MASSERGAYEANDAFLGIIGYTREDLAAGRISYPAITAPESAGRDREAFEQLLAKGAFQPYEKEYLHRDGHRVPVLVGGAAVDTDPPRWVTFVVDLTARQRAEQERAELLAREQAARAEADGAREQITFLLRAGAFAAATRDRHELLEHAAQVVVPGLADHCVVYVPTEDDALQATSFDLRYANSGHPPPLLRTGTGQAEFLDDAPGVMLGVCAEISLPAGRRRLTPGIGLLLYTDGLVEDRSRDIDEGLSGIVTAVKRSGARTTDQMRAAAESVLSSEPSRADDVCLLAARLPD